MLYWVMQQFNYRVCYVIYQITYYTAGDFCCSATKAKLEKLGEIKRLNAQIIAIRRYTIFVFVFALPLILLALTGHNFTHRVLFQL
jgi:hypothetical protein